MYQFGRINTNQGKQGLQQTRKRMNELNRIVKSGSAEERQSAAKESEACLSQIRKMSDEFDQIRKEAGAVD